MSAPSLHHYWRDNINPDVEPLKVMIKRDKLVDVTRDDRLVKIKVYYPVNHDLKNLPVIVWSHGLGGSVDGASFLSRFISSHGFVIVHVQHHGTDSSLWEGKPGHPWDVIRKTNIPRSATLNRFQDVPFVLDQLPEWMENHPSIGDICDLDNMGMSGHSFGALTTQVMAGMMFPDEQGKLRRFRESRFKAGILYSPSPINHLAFDAPEDIYGTTDIPLFHMTGTQDGSPIEDWGYEKRLVVYRHITKATQHLLVIQDGDHMVFTGSRGQLGENDNREKHETIIKISALAYWEMMLKGNADAENWLLGNSFQDWLGNDGSFE